MPSVRVTINNPKVSKYRKNAHDFILGVDWE